MVERSRSMVSARTGIGQISTAIVIAGGWMIRSDAGCGCSGSRKTKSSLRNWISSESLGEEAPCRVAECGYGIFQPGVRIERVDGARSRASDTTGHVNCDGHRSVFPLSKDFGRATLSPAATGPGASGARPSARSGGGARCGGTGTRRRRCCFTAAATTIRLGAGL